MATLMQRIDGYFDPTGSVLLADAMAEIESLRKDAERYRWLRGNQATYDLTDDDDRLTLIRFVTEIFPPDGESMADAIDAGIDEKMAAG